MAKPVYVLTPIPQVFRVEPWPDATPAPPSTDHDFAAADFAGADFNTE